MSADTDYSTPISIAVENIGGIETSEHDFTSKTTILAGRNATNRTSLLQAIMAACGSENVTLKGDADTGFVKLTVGDQTYTRTLDRRNESIVTGGEPMLEDSELADRFAFLLESNEARRAITRGDNLRNVLLGPVDTEAIEAEIAELQSEKRQLEEELNEIDSLKQQLPTLEDQRQSLESEIKSKRDQLQEKETELTGADADVDDSRDDQSELEDKLEELRDIRSSLEDIRYRTNTHEEIIANLQDEREELENELEALPDTPAGELGDIDAQLDQFRTQRSTLDSEISKIQNVIQFNQDMLGGTDSTDLVNALQDNGNTGVLTDQLVDDETVVCWTCGSEVDRTAVEDTLDRLRSLHQDKVETVTDIEASIEELTTRRKTLEQQADRRNSVESRINQLADEIEDRQSTLEDLQGQRSEYEDRIDDLEQAVEELEDEVYAEILELHRETNQLEFDIGKLESDLEDVTEQIQTIDNRLAERETIEAQLDEFDAEITDLRTKIERIEQEAVTQFNEHMAEVLERLEYRNIDRIWIERVEREVRKDRRKVVEGQFELHVIRESDDGVAYEDTIDHLSESEREVVGLIFALAGYLVHEVHERCPFMVLDSLEALDQGRISVLIDYLNNYAEFLIVALLPEDAAAINESDNDIVEF